MTNLLNKYFDYQINFEKKYGENTIVLMQVGSFFEVYGVDNEKEKIGDLQKITAVLNITLTRRNKAILENSRENCLMAGIPTRSIKRYLNILLKANYTIILIEQVTEPPNPKREITNIYSPGTYIEEINTCDSRNISSIYLEECKCLKTGKYNYSLGLSNIDLSTGNNTIYETHSLNNDFQKILEEIYRFIESFNPSEIIFNNQFLNDKIKEKVINTINCSNRLVHVNKNNNKEFFKLTYQNTFLKKIFNYSGILSPIEYLNLERIISGLNSYIFLLQFSYEHNNHIIEKINKPKIWKSENHLILYNNSIYQLNILPNSNNINGGIKSLFDVINFTSTSMGRRLLKYRLCNPIIDEDILNKRYKLIEGFYNNNSENLVKINKLLNEIIDIERLHRKMGLLYLRPFEFYSLTCSYSNIVKLIDILKDNFIIEDFEITNKEIKSFNNYIQEYKNTFETDILAKSNFNNIEQSFIKKGICEHIDKIQINISDGINFFENEKKKISNYIEKDCDFVKLMYTDRDGYFFYLTKKRSEILKKNIKENGIDFSYEIKRYTNSNVKLINKELINKSNNLITSKERLKKEVKKIYKEKILEFYNNYNIILKKISNFISIVDLVNSSYKCSKEYGYNRPIIRKKSNSFFEATKIRHPIIERLPFSPEYITNDVSLGNKLKGILLYGVNGSGKSSLSKAIGLNIVLAQMGMFVPAENFIYSPYHKIFTRITSEDNLFKGQSSFMVEMIELRSILKYSDSNSIVLGDEICKGTEETSALAIVYASIKSFLKENVNFLLATHFHKLYDMCKYESINGINFKHLSVEYDNDIIIYGRKLLDGPGNNIYGLEIAKYIINNKNFINVANKTRDKILKKNKLLIDKKVSNYNKNLYIDECIICGKNKNQTKLDTHHIKEQYKFNSNKLLEHIKKDNIDNLVVLCEEHHKQVHHGNLVINGFKYSNKGRVLDYKFIKKKKEKKKKFGEKEKIIILEYKNSLLSKKLIVQELFNKHKIKISDSTIKKIWKGIY